MHAVYTVAKALKFQAGSYRPAAIDIVKPCYPEVERTLNKILRNGVNVSQDFNKPKNN